MKDLKDRCGWCGRRIIEIERSAPSCVDMTKGGYDHVAVPSGYYNETGRRGQKAPVHATSFHHVNPDRGGLRLAAKVNHVTARLQRSKTLTAPVTLKTPLGTSE